MTGQPDNTINMGPMPTTADNGGAETFVIDSDRDLDLCAVRHGGLIPRRVLSPAAILRMGTERTYCDVEVQDIHLDEVHLAIVRMQNGWLFMETGRRDLTRFNGVLGRQQFVSFSGSLVLHLGSNTFVFRTVKEESAMNRAKKAFILKNEFNDGLAAASLPEASVQFAELFESEENNEASGGKAQSKSFNSDSLLFGANRRCDFLLNKSGIAQVHAFTFWGEDGVYIEDFGSTAGTSVNDEKIGSGKSAKLKDGDKISFGEAAIAVSFSGDVAARAAALTDARRVSETIKFAALKGSLCDDFSVSENDGSLVLGRGTDATLVLLDTGVSRNHAKLRYENKRVWITDLQSANGIFINGRQIQMSAGGPGDLVDVGNNTYLLHYL